MPALGEDLRFGYPQLVTEEQLELSSTELDVAVQGIYDRMFDLAPTAGHQRAFSRQPIVRESPRVHYPAPGDPLNSTMSAWLATVNWKTNHGPFQNTGQGGQEVKLITQATHHLGLGRRQPQPQAERVVASAGRLTILMWLSHPLLLEGLRPQAAANVIADINETLDLFV